MMDNKLVEQGSGKYIIGLTGVFGVGKSTVAKFFEEFGALVIDADKLAHEALRKDSSVFESIALLFADCLENDGSLSREQMSAVVFANPDKRKDLEAIVHPYVLERIREIVQQASKGIIILEVPLLFEAGFDVYCDQTVTVHADPADIEARLVQKGFTASEVKDRWGAQASQDEKVKKANLILRNTKDLLQTKQEAQQIWKQILSASKGE